MMLKKSFVFSFALILFLFSINFVSASVPEQVNSFFTEVAKTLEPALKFVLGGVEGTYTSDLLIIKILVFVLLLAIVYMATKKIPMINNESWLVWLISIVVSTLSVRFLTSSALIELVWLPSGVLGISFMCLFPLVLYFFFVKDIPSRTIRRFAWVFFIIIYVTMAVVRWDALVQDMGNRTWNLGWIYIFTAIIALISLLLDKTIQNTFNQILAENSESIVQSQLAIQISNDFNTARTAQFSGTPPLSKSKYNALLDNLASRAKAGKLKSLSDTIIAAKLS